jgi:hypothetical protein
MQTILIAIIVIFFISILRVIYGLMFSKKVKPIDAKRLEYEVGEAKIKKHQIFILFQDGYWEIKEEVHSQEWSANGGTQNYIDFDLEINDNRYFEMMGKNLIRDKEGEHSLKIVKEIEITKDLDIEKLVS